MRCTIHLRLVLALAAVVLPLAGCKKKPPQPEPAVNPLNPIGQQPAQTDIRRGAERQVNQNELKQLAIYYLNYDLENNRPPATLADFLAYLQKDINFPKKMIAPLEQGHIVLVPGVKPTSSQVVAYEKEAFQKANNRLVAFGDGRVELMNDNDFRKFVPAKDK